MRRRARSRSLLLVAALLLAGCSGVGVRPDAFAAAEAERSAVAEVATPITGGPQDFAPLVAAARSARFILLGESTHGTHEFYEARGLITEQLIREAGVGAVAIEGDAPQTERVNRYVRGVGDDRSAEQALSAHTRFPRWMWRNAEFADFVERLRAHNLAQPPERRVGVYGMDVYALYEAAEAVTAYLDRVDPSAAAEVRTHYRCFARYKIAEAYGLAARSASRSCEKPAEAALARVRALPMPAEAQAAEARFAAVRNAASVAGAEAYFRISYGGAYAWNVRDGRMTETVEEIAEHVERVSGRPGRVVVWAHNTHVGDARATEMTRRGELNLGQLLRQRHGERAFLTGFLTHEGTVMAAPEWDRPGRVYTLRPASRASYAALLRQAGLDRALLVFRGRPPVAALTGPRRERAVGVIYLPQEEASAHYFDAELTRQFDAVAYFDRSRAVTPLP
jgi:erythromycin esterase-like protein